MASAGRWRSRPGESSESTPAKLSVLVMVPGETGRGFGVVASEE